MFDKNLLSKEEQENFIKYSNEYDKIDKSVINHLNEETKIEKTLKSRKVLIIVMIITMTFIIIGISKSLLNIMNQQDAMLSAKQAKQNQITQTTPSSQPINDNSPVEQENKQSQQELDKIKQDFHPFEGEIDSNNIPTEYTPQNINNNQSLNNNNNNNSNPYYNNNNPLPTLGARSNSQPINNNNSYNPSFNQSPTDFNNSTPENYFSLKGIAMKNGEKICYINNGTSTSLYHENDNIDGYNISQINNSSVILIDSNGNTISLTK